MRIRFALFIAFALAAATLPHAAVVPSVSLGVKGRANSDASIAARGSVVALTWAARSRDGVTDIYTSVSRDDGRSFDTPVRVNQAQAGASVSGEQPPRVALVAWAGNEPAIVVVWTAKGPTGTRLVFARSDDGGRSFGPSRTVPGTGAGGNRGWESIAIDGSGAVVAVWLDHRNVPAREADAHVNGAHQHGGAARSADESVARAQLSQLFFGRLDDPRSVRSIAAGVCYCCKTSLAAGTDGRLFAAWRHVYPGNVRDIVFTASRDGGRTFAAPVRVSSDGWAIDGCPENGPALAVDASNAVHVVWPTVVRDPGAEEPTMALFHAMSKDGRPFTPRQRIRTDGVPRHAQIALGSDGRIAVAWDEQRQGARRVVVAQGTIDGTGPVRLDPEPLAGSGGGSYPVIATSRDGVVAAWTSGAPDQSVLHVTRFSWKR